MPSLKRVAPTKVVDIVNIGDEIVDDATPTKKKVKATGIETTAFHILPADSHCYCNKPVMKRKVNKVSKNTNRNFITCAEKLYDAETLGWMGGCTFFKWEDECEKVCDTCLVFKAATKDASRHFCANTLCDLKTIMRQKTAEKKERLAALKATEATKLKADAVMMEQCAKDASEGQAEPPVYHTVSEDEESCRD